MAALPTALPSTEPDRSAALWAWEFLRRNPAYQADYHAFIQRWRALEADYGTPPNRDFARWKRDPRAYGPLTENETPFQIHGEQCVAVDDRVLLECWMGAKWGFYKFPLDPTYPAPTSEELSWRPLPLTGAEPVDARFSMNIAFDLSLPLPPQLEAAKLRLLGRAVELRRQGLAAPMTVANQSIRWLALLTALDQPETADAALLRAAQTMADTGYREILRLIVPEHGL